MFCKHRTVRLRYAHKSRLRGDQSAYKKASDNKCYLTSYRFQPLKMVSHSLSNVAAIGVSYYTPAQDPPVGTAITPQPADKAIPLLFQPIQIRGVKFQNRIFVGTPSTMEQVSLRMYLCNSWQLSPLGQDSAENGHFNRWHLTQCMSVDEWQMNPLISKFTVGGIISRGPGLSMIESTAVLPEGRTSPQATGLYLDSHIEPLRQIVEFAHSQNQKIGIQLCHGGRKASSIAPWIGQEGVSKEDVGGWPGNIWGPIDVEETVDTLETKQAPKEYLRKAVDAFAASATRAVKAGVDVIEIREWDQRPLFARQLMLTRRCCSRILIEFVLKSSHEQTNRRIRR